MKRNAAAVLLVGSLLTACGSGDHPTAHVASLPPSTAAPSGTPADGTPADATPADGGSETSQTPGSPSGAADTAGRPQERVDDSTQRRAALEDAWIACLYAHGATRKTTGVGAAASSNGVVYPGTVPPTAQAACLHLEPLAPPQLSPATNPHFHDDAVRYADCMRRGGVYITFTTSTGLDWTYTAGHPVPDDESRVEQHCLLTSFGDR